jgi:hypothetical protein
VGSVLVIVIGLPGPTGPSTTTRTPTDPTEIRNHGTSVGAG